MGKDNEIVFKIGADPATELTIRAVDNEYTPVKLILINPSKPDVESSAFLSEEQKKQLIDLLTGNS